MKNWKKICCLKTLKQKLLSRERKLLEAENRIIALENENTLLREKLTAAEKKLERVSKSVFDTERFKCDENISFYTGFPDFNTCIFISALSGKHGHTQQA